MQEKRYKCVLYFRFDGYHDLFAYYCRESPHDLKEGVDTRDVYSALPPS